MNKELVENYKKIDWDKLLRSDLGDHHLKALKPHLNTIRKIIDFIINHPQLQELPRNERRKLEAHLPEFQSLVNYIKNDHQDVGQNQNMIEQVIEREEEWKKIILSLKPFLDFFDSNHALDNNLEKYQRIIKELEGNINKVRELESQKQGQMIKREASQYGDFFKNEAKRNQRWAWVYFGLTIASAIACAGLAYCTFKIPDNIVAQTLPELIIKGNVLNKVFIFSIMILVITLLRREYLALRHQFTLNTHRYNAIKSHKEILSSLEKTQNDSDREISNAILLELTKAMFDTQNTGFINQEASSRELKVIEVTRSLLNSPPRSE